jgi:hypothetical protein
MLPPLNADSLGGTRYTLSAPTVSRKTRNMSHRLESVHPVLMSSDILRSLEFFDTLGFTRSFVDDADNPRYAAIRRDAVELHLQWHQRSQWAHDADLPVYRLLVSDVDSLFAEFLSIGAAPSRHPSPWAQPGDTPWGTREFHLRDPDGNGLQFYQSL